MFLRRGTFGYGNIEILIHCIPQKANDTIQPVAAKTACDQGRHNLVGRLQSMGMPTNFWRRLGTLPTPIYQRNAMLGRVRDEGGARATGSGEEACEGVRATGLSAATVSSFRSLAHFSTALAVWRMPSETRIQRIGSRLCIHRDLL